VNLAEKKHMRRFGLAMLLYSILIVGVGFIIRGDRDASWRYLVAVVPVLPGVWALLSIRNAILSRDELGRRIQFEAITFAFSSTLVVALTIGLLEMAGVPQLNGAYYVSIMVLLWGLGQYFAQRRYR
jgi:hypothetical protein